MTPVHVPPPSECPLRTHCVLCIAHKFSIVAIKTLAAEEGVVRLDVVGPRWAAE